MNAAPQRQDVDVSPSSSSEPASMLVGGYSFDLARQIGLDGSAFISQVHYWLQRSKNFRIEDGCRWIWNTVNQWLEQFSWMSRRKLERVIAKLESLGILLSQKFWKHQWNHTKWYRLDYKKLQKDYNWVPTDKLQEKPHQSSATVPRVTLQTEPAKLAETPTSECGNRLRQNDGFIYRDYIQEITSKENTPLPPKRLEKRVRMILKKKDRRKNRKPEVSRNHSLCCQLSQSLATNRKPLVRIKCSAHV